MKKRFYVLWIIIFLIGASACTTELKPVSEATIPSSQPATAGTVVTRTCQPTLDDGVSPSYQPNAPERTVVGHGHVLTGIVLSSADCEPIPNAKLEFWPEEAGLGHPDSSRATFFTGQNGQYRFECNLPEHIHMRISAPGYKTIGVNSYHPEGKTEGVFDIVLEPEETKRLPAKSP